MRLRDLLTAQELTTLRLQVGSGGRTSLELARDFDPQTPFESYGHCWPVDQIRSSAPRRLGDAESRRLLQAAGLGDSFRAIEDDLRRGGHEAILLTHHARLSLTMTHFVHSSTLGLRSGFHGLRAGGIRRHDQDASDREVFDDGLRLSRAMSFKCAWAELPYGGSKSSVQAQVLSTDDEQLGFLAWCIDRGHLITGPDVGFPTELIDALSARFTRHILCGARSPLGHTGGPTAEGVFIAMKAAATQRWGSADLKGRRIAIQGVGAVGFALAKALLAEGASVIASEIDDARRAHCQELLPALEWVDADEILTTACDIFAPCALGAVLDERTIAKLRCEMVYGAANNPLDARSIDDELGLASALHERGILFQPDFTITCGGVIAGHEEAVHRDQASMSRVSQQIQQACGIRTRTLLEQAHAQSLPPSVLCYRQLGPRVRPEIPV